MSCGFPFPDEIFERMAKATTVDAARAEGVAIARDMLAAVRHMVQGAQIAAPFGRYSCAVDVLEALGRGRQGQIARPFSWRLMRPIGALTFSPITLPCQ